MAKDVKFKILSIIPSNTNGVMILPIEEYGKRKLSAVNGGTISLFSPPFYTEQYGYKMCAVVYINGDGTGKGRYISFYFSILKGDYDGINEWPFNKKITLSLISQRKDKASDHVEMFSTGQSSSSFMRPTEWKNLPSGSPKFYDHSKLESPDNPYLVRDTIYLKITVANY